MQLIGHRGTAPQAPENTSFDLELAIATEGKRAENAPAIWRRCMLHLLGQVTFTSFELEAVNRIKANEPAPRLGF